MKHFIFSCIFLLQSCRDCSADKIITINNLKNEKKIVAYVGKCGATVDDDINVSFYESDDDLLNIAKHKGDIFSAYHATGVTLERISCDTVKIIYAARKLQYAKEKVGDIYFIYELNWKRF